MQPRKTLLRHAAMVCGALVALAGVAWAAAPYFAIGYQFSPQGSKPFLAGKAGMWADTTGNKRLRYTDSANTDRHVPSIAATTKGDLAAWSGSDWVRLPAGADGTCLIADSAQTSGWLAGACGGGGAGSFAATYTASSNPVRVSEDNTRSSIILRANAANNAILQFENNAGSTVGGVDADGAFRSYSMYSLVTASDSLLLQSSAANSGTNNGVEINNQTTLGGNTTIVTFGTGAPNVVKASIFNDGTFLGPGATLTKTALATTTATAALLRNTTAATGGAQVQVSPSLDFEGTDWSGAASEVSGGGFYLLPGAASYPYLVYRHQWAGGAYTNVGRLGPGYAGQGFSIGDYPQTNYIDLGGAASGANAIRIVAAGFSHTVFDAGGMYPYSDLGTPVGKAANRYTEMWSRRYAGVEQTVAAAATISLDPAAGERIRVTLGATAVTTVNAGAGYPDECMRVEIIQDATGGRSISGWSSSFVLAGGAYTVTATANKRDQLTFCWDATASKWYEAARVMNL